MTSEITLQSPAKINLYLDILGKREDGFHELCTVMQEVDLCDSITVKISNGDDISVTAGQFGHIEGENNIAYKAASLFKEKLKQQGGKDFSVSIDIEKHIPMGGGLGGGSSNGAYVLRALNSLCDNALAKEDLLAISAELGSDVAFFVEGKTALCLGRGEIIKQQVKAPESYYVLFNPGVEIPTPSVYKNLDLASTHDLKPDADTFISELNGGKVGLYNFLETAVFKLYPQEKEIKEKFIELGAVGSIVSGSGATVLALADSFEHAEDIKKGIDKEFEGKSWVVKTY